MFINALMNSDLLSIYSNSEIFWSIITILIGSDVLGTRVPKLYANF